MVLFKNYYTFFFIMLTITPFSKFSIFLVENRKISFYFRLFFSTPVNKHHLKAHLKRKQLEASGFSHFQNFYKRFGDSLGGASLQCCCGSWHQSLPLPGPYWGSHGAFLAATAPSRALTNFSREMRP